MNVFELQKKLIATARRQPADDRVPYAFEKRIMALIYSAPVVDRWALWARGLSRAALSCVALALVCVALSLYVLPLADNGNDLSQDFENTLLASADQNDNSMVQ